MYSQINTNSKRQNIAVNHIKANGMISLANCSNLSAMRRHGNLQKDEEANAAASEALKGAAIGASRVCSFFALLPLKISNVSEFFKCTTGLILFPY